MNNIKIEHQVKGILAVLSTIIVAMFPASTGFSATTAKERTGNLESTYFIRLFECNIPIPSSYVLHADELGSYRFSRYGSRVGTITISKFSIGDQQKNDFNFEERSIYGDVSILFIRSKASSSSPVSVNAVVIHDKKHALSIIGDDISHWETVANTCIAEWKAKGDERGRRD